MGLASTKRETNQLKKKAEAKYYSKKMFGSFLPDKNNINDFLANVDALEEILNNDFEKAYPDIAKERAKKLLHNIKKDQLVERIVTNEEAFYLVKDFYQIQKERQVFMNRARRLHNRLHPELEEFSSIEQIKKAYPKLTDDQIKAYAEPHNLSQYFAENLMYLETAIAYKLKQYVLSKPLGRWLMSICGIGPVISAGLLSHIKMEYKIYDKAPGKKNRKVIRIERVQTAGSLQKHAGINPGGGKRIKGQPCDFNQNLKVLFWKAAESFWMQKRLKNDYYGRLMLEKKKYYEEKNAAGGFAERCKEILREKQWKQIYEYENGNKTSYSYYKEGKLPPAHIMAMTKRWAMRIFCCHIFKAFYQEYFHEESRRGYEFVYGGHAHEIGLPNYTILDRKEFGLWIPERELEAYNARML